MDKQICLYFKESPQKDRWFIGDSYLRNFIKKMLGKQNRVSSLKKVFNNLCLGFDKINISYSINQPFNTLKKNDVVVILGLGLDCLKGYKQSNPIIAGIGLMTHPSEWPTLFTDYPVKVYLQHSTWTNNIYQKYYKNCSIWFAGINSEEWKPQINKRKNYDILIYDKIMWDKENQIINLLTPIEEYLISKKLTYQKITYGSYTPAEYKSKLNASRAMLFLCEHESQGLAYQEALSMNVPILAWKQGFWLDPNRFVYGEQEPVLANSVPYFSDECGMIFRDFSEFCKVFPIFLANVLSNKFSPRSYILNNLTLEKSAILMLKIIDDTL